MAPNTSIPTTALSTAQEKPNGPKPKVNEVAIANSKNISAITSRLDNAQTLKGARALLKHTETARKEKKQKALASGQPQDLFEDEGGDLANSSGSGGADHYVWLVLTTKKFITDKRKIKPVRIQLAHPLHDAKSVSACLIVKDPQRFYKNLLLTPSPSPDSTVQKIIDITHLRKKFKSFESLRQLRDSYDFFLADDRVVLSLKKVLGTTFLRITKKIPIAVNIADKKTASKINTEIEKAVKATYLHLTPTTGTTVRVGNGNMSAEQLMENIEKVMEHATKKVIPGGWNGVRSLYIKTTDSVALPIYLADNLFEEKDVKTEEDIKKEKLRIEEQKKKKSQKRAAKKAKAIDAIEEERKKRKAEDDIEGGVSGSTHGNSISPPKKRKVEKGEENNRDKKIKLEERAEVAATWKELASQKAVKMDMKIGKLEKKADKKA